ncbi:MAG: hypothetical protein JST89_23320 [Cyanobacteria bacterium SZAS-4]|nr:hypothetical protein [Cyanobacteria bacterium SZAS-4]
MRKIVFLLSASFVWSSAIGFAAEPAKPKVDLNQKASDAVKDIGDNMNKAGSAIKKSVNDAGKKINDAGKKINEAESKASNKAANSKDAKSGGSKSDDGKPDVGERLQIDAKHALKKVEAEADKAEHAIVTTVKGMGKKGATNGSGGKSGTKAKGSSLDQSIKDLGKNAEKAGTAMENGVKKLGSDAKKEVEKADQAIKKKVDHK